MKKIILTPYIIVLSLLFSSQAFAIREPRPLSIDSRLRVINYNPNDVFKFVGYYGYQSSIVFSDGETVETITMGDTIAWQIVPNGNRIFLKPMEENATTNMTVISNIRVYHFELHAKEAKDIYDPELVFSVKFLYPDENNGGAIQNFVNKQDNFDEFDKEKYNYNYSISGPESIAPVRIFDDGIFTYFKFRDKNAELPAFFIVDSLGKENLVNYRIDGKYLVVEKVAEKYTLRHGNDIVCVFNENMFLTKDTSDAPEKETFLKKVEHKIEHTFD